MTVNQIFEFLSFFFLIHNLILKNIYQNKIKLNKLQEEFIIYLKQNKINSIEKNL
jgi:hypothetical protein